MEPSRLAAMTAVSALVLVVGAVTVAELRSSSPPPPEPVLDPTALPVSRLPDGDPEEKLSSADDDAHDEAVAELVAAIEAEWPDDHRRAFLVAVTPRALEGAVEHCIPPSVTVGQAILESGWGRSGLARDHDNLFGVKAGAASGVELPTVEGAGTATRARFRTYDGWDASIAHHQELLSTDPRYAEAREQWEHWPQFLEAVAPVYASDPEYVARVRTLVESYELDRWDAMVRRVARRRADCPGL